MNLFACYDAILQEELVPAMGCTEPISLALAAAVIRKTLHCIPESVKVSCSGNIIKNVKGVVVPGTGGLKGIPVAVAAGLIAGNPDGGLETIAQISQVQRDMIQDLAATSFCQVECLHGVPGLEIRMLAYKGEQSAFVHILHSHTNIVRIELNNEILLDDPDNGESTEGMRTDRSTLTIQGIYDYAKHANLYAVKELLEKQITRNRNVAREGLENEYGAAVGKVLLETSDDIYTKCVASAAAGSDARMSGCQKSVMTCCGSGNQGMTVSLPVLVFESEKGIAREQTIRALALSNLIAVRMKRGIGRLSAFCGVVCAATGAVCGIAFLEGHGPSVLNSIITNQIATISGMVCDGAKPSCAGKIVVALQSALMAYKLAICNRTFKPEEGIIKTNIEDTIDTMGRLAREGMGKTDQVLLDIMTGC